MHCVHFSCPACRSSVTLPGSHHGQLSRCPACTRLVRIPGPDDWGTVDDLEDEQPTETLAEAEA